jgi:hypothetical protein
MMGGCLIIVLAMLLCSGGAILAVDQMCYTTLSNRLPIYPGAEIRVERHNFFRAFGMGETYLELHTPDDSDTVGRWYGGTAGAYSREAVRTNNFTYRLASAERSFRRAEGEDGTFIQLYGACAQ